MDRMIPAALRQNGRFCVWRLENGSRGPTKVPYNARTGGHAQSTNPATFCDFNTASSAAGRYSGLGIGIFDGLTVIDMDHCVTEGLPDEHAADVMKLMHSYTEISPSGTGLHIFFTAPAFTLDKETYYMKNSAAGLECYIAGQTSRFMTITGNAVGDYGFGDRREELQIFLDSYMVRPVKPAAASERVFPCLTLSDTAIIQKAQRASNGARFRALYTGDAADYASRSEADAALCALLAFYTKDAEQLDRLFRSSGLMRPKWDRPQSGTTYGKITLANAIGHCRGGYDPQAYFRRMVDQYVREE